MKRSLLSVMLLFILLAALLCACTQSAQDTTGAEVPAAEAMTEQAGSPPPVSDTAEAASEVASETEAAEGSEAALGLEEAQEEETAEDAEEGPEPEPLVLTLTVPETATATADAPVVALTCALTRTGDGPETGQFRVYQNDVLVRDIELPLETGEGTVNLTYEFTRYMTQTCDTVRYELLCGDTVLTAETAVNLENWPDEVYAKASGAALPYAIEVVKNHNMVLIYGMDESGAYTQLVKTFLCSTGQWTPLGEFTATTRYEGWRTLYANAQHTAYCYGQYAIVISGDYLFHSVPYYTPNKDDLEYEEFNKLGTQASLGCIRLAVADVKWIYDNCPYGTHVSIVEREELGVEKPEALYIDPDSPYCGWDPTDPDPENPWQAWEQEEPS